MSRIKKTVLVADDDLAILDVTKIILEEGGYRVLTSGDGAQVYKMLKEHPDLLLLDIRMPGTGGCEICKVIKSNSDTKDIPIILFSANLDGAKMAHEAGAEDFISKPFEMTELVEKVQKYTS